MRHTLLFMTLAVVGCGEGLEQGEGVFGIPMVASEELRIGSPDDPDAAFTWFRELEVGPDGTIYTGHPQESQIRMHSAAGEFLGTIGRDGEGPGEFDRLGVMALVNDTVWVMDHGLYRFSYFALDGTFLGSRRIPVDLGDSPSNNPPRPTKQLRDGTIIGAPPAFSHLVAAGEMNDNFVVALDTAGNPGDTLAHYSLVNTVWEISNHAQGPAYFGSYRQQPFGDTEIVQFSDYDMVGVRVVRGMPEPGTTPVFSVTSWRVGGDTVFSRGYAYRALSLRTEIVDSIIDEFAESVANSEFLQQRATYAEAAAWAREGLYLPMYHPPVSALVIAQDGRLWIRGEELGEPTVRWTILAPDGEPVGTVELPSGFTMMFARNSTVWGGEYDELDVPYIVRYRVSPAAKTD